MVATYRHLIKLGGSPESDHEPLSLDLRALRNVERAMEILI
jgi:hypothetical protein